MAVLGAIVAILTIIGLILQIAKNTGGIKTTTSTVQGHFDEGGKFHPGPALPAPLPLTQEEFDRQLASMPVEWVTYMGATPSVRLKIRGVTELMYRQICRKYINMMGQEQFERMPFSEKDAVIRMINSELYVLDWDGAAYPNGNPMPFSPSALMLLLDKDQHLRAFLSDEVARISPKSE
jgi:hypothetical protein